MKHWLKIGLLMWLLMWLPGQALALAAGDPAPDFTLPDAAGKPVTLSSLRGQFVYVDFWASWCGPCRQSFPWMNQLSRQRGVRVVAINVDEHRDDATAFLRQRPANFTVAYDPDGQAAARYQLPGMPTSVLVGPDGRVRWTHIGFRSGDDKRLQALIQAEMRTP